MGIAKLEEMTWIEVDRLDKNNAIALVPISPIEEHGPHLPLGTDLFGARDIASLAAQQAVSHDPQLEVVITPSIPLGASGSTADFPGTISLRGTTLKAVVLDVCNALAGHGFRNILIFNHHMDPVHMKAILDAVDAVSAAYDLRIAELLSRIYYAGIESEEDRYVRSMGLEMEKEIHADAKETAYIAYRYPELVKVDPQTLPAVHIDVRDKYSKGMKTFKAMGAQMGYIGSPSAATKSLGQLHLENGARLAAELIGKMMKGDPLPEISPKMKHILKNQIQLD